MLALVSSNPDIMAVEAVEFRNAMRQLASGVTIITTGTGPRRRGITATAVCSLSAEPPALLVCVNRDSETRGAVIQQRRFCINVLGGARQALARRFAGHGGVKGLERFAEGDWMEHVTGSPMLRDAVAAFDCILREEFEGGTHSIFVGNVVGVHVGPSQPALVYRDGQFSSVA